MDKDRAWPRVRWSLAVLLLLAGIGYAISGPRVCEDKLATVGGQAVVRACHAPSVSDLPVVGGLLLLVLLLFPDLAEIGIPGFVSLKRRVEEHEATLAGLQLQITHNAEVQQSAAQEVATQASALSVNLIDFEGALLGLQAKSEAADLPARSVRVDVSEQRARLESELLHVWAKLKPLVSRARHAEQASARRPEERDQARAQLGDLGAELRAVRDRLAHNEARLAAARDVNDSQAIAALERDLEMLRAQDAELRAVLHTIRVVVERPARGTVAVAGVPDSESFAMMQWGRDFEQEIKIIETAQRTVADAEPLDDRKLGDAVRLAESLWQIWQIRKARLPNHPRAGKEPELPMD